MTPLRFLRGGALLALASTVIYAPSCSSDSANQSGNADVLLQGNATPDALGVYLGATPDEWAWAGGEISAPSDRAVLSAVTPQTFAWYTDTSAPDGGPGGPAPGAGSAADSGAAGAGSAAGSGATGALWPLSPGAGPLPRWLGPLGPERAAWASSAPLTGACYLLVFSTPSHPRLVRLLTTLTSYTPDPAAWNKLVTARAPITLQLSAATFDTDMLTAEGGPHIGQAISFTIE